MNEVVITISIRVPDGVTPDVSYGAALPSAPAPRTQPASSPPPTAGWVCPIHGSSKVVPAGTSKKTGKPYKAFVACDEVGCDEKPPRGQGPAEVPASQPANGSQFDELPF